MSLCDLNCCDLKYLQRKFDAINKKINDNQKIQDKINANIFELLKESGINVEELLKNYYALNEDDYTKTLTSEDDINTLEPGTYKIVKEDMPQNAPTGVASSNYDGTLIQSNSYAILFENGYLHIGKLITGINRFSWSYVINSNLINIHLQYYMLISRYSDGEFIDDIHTLSQNTTGVFIVNSATQNLPVQQNGIIIVRIGTATNSLFVTFIPEDSFDVYYCAKKADGTWTEWGQVAFMSDVPSLEGYATQAWVNEQISEITGGAVTSDVVSQMISDAILGYATQSWVNGRGYQTATQVSAAIMAAIAEYATETYTNKNFLSLNKDLYTKIQRNDDLNNYKTKGCYYSIDANITTTLSNIPNGLHWGFKLTIEELMYNDYLSQKITENFTGYIYIRISQGQKGWLDWKRIAYMRDLPNLSNYATQEWIQSQNYLTEIPDEYTTDTEVSQAIAAALVGYATQAWVNSQGFLTEIPEEYVTLTELQAQNYATQSWVNSQGFIKGNMTLYTTVDQLDISYPTTTLNVFKAMANNSLLIFGTDTTYITDLPVNSGILEITKVSNIRYKIVLYKSSGGTIPVNKGMYLATTNSTLDNLTWEAVVFTSDLNNEATQEWVGQQGYQTVQQVNSLINTATADMLTQEDLDTLNYATENWVLQTALDGYATENWINTKLNNYLPKKETIALTTQGTHYGLQYQWVRYGQVVEIFLVGNLTQEISNQLISDFSPANPMEKLRVTIPGYDSKTNYAEFNGNGLKLMGTYSNELYVNCHFTYLTNE